MIVWLDPAGTVKFKVMIVLKVPANAGVIPTAKEANKENDASRVKKVLRDFLLRMVCKKGGEICRRKIAWAIDLAHEVADNFIQ